MDRGNEVDRRFAGDWRWKGEGSQKKLSIVCYGYGITKIVKFANVRSHL